ncbi:hypothetical protein [Streptomyces sp. NPDC002962]|uniref:hypothetical protein n=1 Tax=Streptomyces sp. NPDC002962 TaxID=3364674 RepID=UPI0036A4A705
MAENRPDAALLPALGIHADPESKDLQFLMPRPGEAELNYSVDAGLAIASVLGMKLTKQTIKIVYPKVGSLAVEVFEVVVGAQLFDTAAATMLETLGDGESRAGSRALQDARAERGNRRKNWHRARAATHLESAYEGYVAAIGERKKTWAHDKLGWRSKEVTANHAKASGRAVAIALINRKMDLPTAAVTWSERAKEHFDRYCALAAAEHAEPIQHLLPLQENLSQKDLLKVLAERDSRLRELQVIPEAEWNWDGSRTGEEWAEDLFTAGGVMVAFYFGKTLAYSWKSKEERVAGNRTRLLARQEAATALLQLNATRREFSELYQRITGQP